MTSSAADAPGAHELALLVASHERSMLERALAVQAEGHATARVRLLVAEHGAASLGTGITTMGAALAEVADELEDVRGSRTFRSWATVSGYDRRRRRRSPSPGETG
jgi:hypothetical protein